MINRGAINKSQYVYNAKTGKLEKKEKNIQTIESLSKQAHKHVNNLSDIGTEVNKMNETPKPINQITVITGEDNLIHNYFYDFEYSWDIGNCLTVATIKMPRMDTENVNYWATYQGPITVYGGHDFTLDKVNGQGHQTEQDAANSLSQYNDISDIKPLFRGTVSRVKEHQTHVTLYVDSIGVRFKQEIPDEFRQMYINNQNVADAFQAICEFLGVQYICPPKKVTESTADVDSINMTENDGTENDIAQQENTTQQIVDTAKNKVNQVNNQVNNDASTDSTTNTNTEANTDTNTDITNNQEIQSIINGYDDINFDANGMIVHGSTVIEESPDMADTLIQMEENPLEKYLEDETGIVEKVQKFLDGDIFEETHGNYMDYGAITVQPASTTTNDISMNTMGNTNMTNLSSDANTTESNNSSSGSSASATKSLQKRDWNGWINGQYYINGKIYLSKEYLNSLTPSQAWAKYQSGQGVYTEATLTKLRARGYWQPII